MMVITHLPLPFLIHSYHVQDNIGTIQDNSKSGNTRNSKQLVDGASNPQKRNKKEILCPKQRTRLGTFYFIL